MFAKPYEKLLFRDETPRWAYKNCRLENICSPKHIKNCCFGMRPRAGFIKTFVWRTCFAKPYLKLLSWVETPRWAYKNCHLENMGPPNHIKNCCFGMMPRAGLIKTAIWRTRVRQTILITDTFSPRASERHPQKTVDRRRGNKEREEN